MKHLICAFILIQILILGPSKGMDINVTKGSISATVGQSVLLETLYALPVQMSKYTIRWLFNDKFILYHDFFTDPEGLSSGNKGRPSIFPNFTRRVEFYPTNASLLLQDLQISDAGNYVVILSAEGKIYRRNITLYVTSITPSCLLLTTLLQHVNTQPRMLSFSLYEQPSVSFRSLCLRSFYDAGGVTEDR
ncbi:HEPACAM family member 2-like isoform X2 [Aquarana catesbeiana]|uniref:HEPACAM family member 2-like isoform X2 n=1 Tax=Aquarana catesbeiana TaxID=8400 RepID=UPI003CC9E18C